MAKKPTTTPSEEPGTAVVPANAESNLPAEFLAQIAKDSGMGNDGVGMDDVTVPYFSVLQGLSPQVQEGHAKYIEGAKAGMIFNTASSELFGTRPDATKPFIFVPCAYERKIIEWLDRDTSGGGYIGEHDIDSDIMSFTERDDRGFNRLKSDPTHILVETGYHYGLGFSHDADMWEPGILSMKSTQLGVSRKWNFAITKQTVKINNRLMQAPRWMYPWRFQTQLMASKRDSNKTYYSLVPVRGPDFVPPDVYEMAKAFHDQVKAGTIKRAVEEDAPTRAAGGGMDDEIPF